MNEETPDERNHSGNGASDKYDLIGRDETLADKVAGTSRNDPAGRRKNLIKIRHINSLSPF